ncbi:hypothetical protein ARMGADRAFT_1070974 [Armillaria gallica]|uniref:Uncharacterized protein n=1 Tax=Armillaria gallica TaxID=47427 RepID=A0A2H3EAT4_ARMGA|nr:hypothetical protein ARMGADRAFT_1070974 [Armillaria gallica]
MAMGFRDTQFLRAARLILIQPRLRTDIPKSLLSFGDRERDDEKLGRELGCLYHTSPISPPSSDISLPLDSLVAWDLTSFGRRPGSAYFHQNMGADMKGSRSNCAPETREGLHRSQDVVPESTYPIGSQDALGMSRLILIQRYHRQRILLSIARQTVVLYLNQRLNSRHCRGAPHSRPIEFLTVSPISFGASS